MLTLHVIEKGDYWHIYKTKTCSHENLKEKFYRKEEYFGELVYIIDFLSYYYPKFNFWRTDIFRLNGNAVRVIFR